MPMTGGKKKLRLRGKLIDNTIIIAAHFSVNIQFLRAKLNFYRNLTQWKVHPCGSIEEIFKIKGLPDVNNVYE